MSIYNALYGRDGHGVGPNEPEKKGFARFCQMVGRDLGQLLGTNLMVCVLCLPAALGVSLGVTLLSLPLTVVCSAVTGLLTGPAMVLLADCALRSLQNDPSQWLPRAKQTLAAHWKAACGFGCIGTLVLGLLCFVSAFVFEAAAQQGYYPGLAILVFLALDFLVLAVLATLCAAVLPLQLPAPDSLLRRAGRLLAVAPARCVLAGVLMLAGIGGMILLFPVSVFWAVLFGFWLPGLAAMQTLFPVLRQEYGVEVRSIPRPAAPDKPLTAQEQKKRSRANWWYYNWGIVAVAAMVIVGVAYVAHGLLTTVAWGLNGKVNYALEGSVFVCGRGRAAPADCAGRLCGGRQRRRDCGGAGEQLHMERRCRPDRHERSDGRCHPDEHRPCQRREQNLDLG